MALKVLIADDNEGMHLVLRKIIGQVEGFELVGAAEDGDACIALAEQTRPDVCFLDVQMPGKDGIECARILQDMNPRTVIVFATAHEEYMGDAFSLYAFDYLLKPFDVERVKQTLRRIQRTLGARSGKTEEEPDTGQPGTARLAPTPKAMPGRLLLKNREGAAFVDLEDILLVQRENRSTVIYAKGDVRHVTSDSLGDMEKKLAGGPFFRCHKSYIINISHIDNITTYGRWTYIARLRGTKQDALITHDKFEELQNMFS